MYATGMRFGLLFLALLAPALVVGKDAAETAIRGVLDKQMDDWNRGDIAAFVLSYAENCTFVGTGVTEGRAGVEQRYRQAYPTPDAMGRLTFSDLKIKKIGGKEAIVTGAARRRRQKRHLQLGFEARRWCLAHCSRPHELSRKCRSRVT